MMKVMATAEGIEEEVTIVHGSSRESPRASSSSSASSPVSPPGLKHSVFVLFFSFFSNSASVVAKNDENIFHLLFFTSSSPFLLTIRPLVLSCSHFPILIPALYLYVVSYCCLFFLSRSSSSFSFAIGFSSSFCSSSHLLLILVFLPFTAHILLHLPLLLSMLLPFWKSEPIHHHFLLKHKNHKMLMMIKLTLKKSDKKKGDGNQQNKK